MHHNLMIFENRRPFINFLKLLAILSSIFIICVLIIVQLFISRFNITVVYYFQPFQLAVASYILTITFCLITMHLLSSENINNQNEILSFIGFAGTVILFATGTILQFLIILDILFAWELSGTSMFILAFSL